MLPDTFLCGFLDALPLGFSSSLFPIKSTYNKHMDIAEEQPIDKAAEPLELRVKDYVLLAVGFGCMIGFVRICSLGFVGYLTYEVSSSLDQWYALRTIFTLATFALLAYVGLSGRFKLGLRTIVAATVLAMTAAIVFAVDTSGVAGSFVAVIGGISSAIFMYVWLLLLSSYKPRVIVTTTLLGLLIAGVLIEGVPIVGPDVGLVLAVASAFASGACVVLVDSDLSSCAADGAFDESTRARMPWLTVVMVVACGFFVSVLYGVSEYMTWLYDWQPNYVVFGVCALLAIVATAAIILQSRNWVHIVWAPLFALFALAIVFACLPTRSTIQIAVGLMMAAVFSSHFLYWMIFPSIFNRLKIPRAFVAGILLICANNSLASLAGDALGAILPRSMQNLSSVAGLMAIVVAILFAATFVANRNRIGSAAAFATDVDALDVASENEGDQIESLEAPVEADMLEDVSTNPIDVLKTRLDDFGNQFGLTPRELEVALYTVQGYSCAYIAEKLVVSNSTVRFHQQNIYRKFDVHSRNELIELVSAE